MKKCILFTVALFFVSLPLYSKSFPNFEKLTLIAAKSVVSISGTIKEKGGEGADNADFVETDYTYSRDFFEEFYGIVSKDGNREVLLGSGILIDKAGYIVTNEHVIAGAEQIKVNLPDGREFDAEITGADKRSDLAVIKIKGKKLPEARIGDSKELKIGQWVAAIGNPFGLYAGNARTIVNVGIISSVDRFLPAFEKRETYYDDLIQIDLAINPGKSGGPLVDLRGRVVGINTAVPTKTGAYQGLGFAISINKAKKVWGKLIKGEKIFYGWLGVNIRDLNDDLRNYFGIKDKKGTVILKVYKDSPAEKGGLREGDLVLTFENRQVESTKQLVKMVFLAEVGEEVPIKVSRAGKIIRLKVRISKEPEKADISEKAKDKPKVAFRGVTVDNITPLYKNEFGLKEDKGVVIVNIESGSSAEKSGLIEGDIIFSAGNKEVKNKDDFESAVSKAREKCVFKTSRGDIVF